MMSVQLCFTQLFPEKPGFCNCIIKKYSFKLDRFSEKLDGIIINTPGTAHYDQLFDIKLKRRRNIFSTSLEPTVPCGRWPKHH